MKFVYILIALLFAYTFATAQKLKHNYQSETVAVPVWLSETDYIEKNENPEENLFYNIREESHGFTNSFEIVSVWLNENQFNLCNSEIYLATFNKNGQIMDIYLIGNYSSHDWGGLESHNITSVNNNTLYRLTIENSYGPVESEEEAAENPGGYKLTNSDTTQEYLRIGNNGKISVVYDPDESDELPVEDEEAIVNNIRTVVSEVNTNIPTYKKVDKDLVENNVLSAFYENSTLRKINVTIYIETDKETEEYFFDKSGKLVFAFLTVKSTKDENRYYFRNETLVRYLKGSNKTKLANSDTDFIIQEAAILDKVNDYKKLLK